MSTGLQPLPIGIRNFGSAAAAGESLYGQGGAAAQHGALGEPRRGLQEPQRVVLPFAVPECCVSGESRVR